MLVIEQNGGKLGGCRCRSSGRLQLKPDVANQVVDKLLEKTSTNHHRRHLSNIMMAVHQKITDKGVFLIGSNAGHRRWLARSARRISSAPPGRTTIRREVVGKYASDKGYKM